MATTPEVLQKQFGLPPEMGTRNVPRVVHAFRGGRAGDLLRLLKVFYPAVMGGALKDEGEHQWSLRDITQAEMASLAGCSRATMTRRMSKIAMAAEGYQTPAERAQHARELRSRRCFDLDLHREECPLCLAGEACPEAERRVRAIGAEHDEAHYARPQATPILHRRRRFMMPNRYHLKIGQRGAMWAIVESESQTAIKTFFDRGKAAKALTRITAEGVSRGQRTYEIEAVELERDERGRPIHYHYAELAQLLAEPSTGAWWDPEFKEVGFKPLARWVWDQRIQDPETGRSLGTIPRLVMSCYLEKGLLDEFRDGHGRGKVTKALGILSIRQKVVARYLGISVKSVYAANRIWEKLGVLRIVAGEPKMTAEGWRRGPQKVIYLPIRMLTEAEAEREAARAEKRLREIVAKEGAQRLAQLMEMRRLHGELLKAWTGREHCMTAFYREASRRLHAALIFPDLIHKFIPPTKPPDPGDGPPQS